MLYRGLCGRTIVVSNVTVDMMRGVFCTQRKSLEDVIAIEREICGYAQPDLVRDRINSLLCLDGIFNGRYCRIVVVLIFFAGTVPR